MANQAIALQARAPQTPGLSGVIQQNAQMINMMMQQKAAERQTAKTEQEMALAQQTANLTAEEKRRAFRKSDMEYLNNQLPGVKDDISWNRWLGELKKVDPGLSDDLLRRTGGRYIPEVVDIIGATAEQYINKTTPTPVASFQVSDQGVPQSVTVGGLAPSTKEIPQYRYEPDQPAAAASVPSMTAEEAAPILKSAAESKTITPEDADRVRRSLGPNGGAQFDQWMTRNNIQVKPISFEQGGVEPLTMENAPQIVDAALKSGMIDPSHIEQLKQMVGPENGAAIDQWVQQSGLKVQQGLPGMRSAVYRPQAQDFGAPVADDGMSFGGPANALRQDIGYVPTTTRFKSPTQSPTPGQYNVPLPVVRGHAGAEEGGKQDVRVVTDPKIEAGKARVVRLEKLRGEMPVALSQSQALVNDLTDRIKAIDDFLRNPYRNTIIGSIEGRIPRLLQSEKRADAQAQFDYITNNTVLDKLISDRQSTETGASPQGIVSDTDLKVAAQAATKLTQTGSERAQEIEMQRLRDVLYRTREQALQKYNNVYREVLKDAPELRIRVKPVTPRYKAYPNGQSQGKKVGQFMVTEVRD